MKINTTATDDDLPLSKHSRHCYSDRLSYPKRHWRCCHDSQTPGQLVAGRRGFQSSNPINVLKNEIEFTNNDNNK